MGTYAIGQGTLTNADNSNYDITYVGTDFSIGKRAVTVTANAGQGKTYGDADPSSYGYSYSDLGNGTALVGALDRASGENVGNYAIGRGTLTDAANSNYDITYVDADFSIGKRSVTVTADAGQGKTYGDIDPSSYSYTSTSLGTGVALVGALDRAAGETVGNYAIGQGGITNEANSNYDISYAGADFSIAKRSVTVTANAGQGKTYGDADPSSYGYSYSYLGNGVALVGALDRAAGENAGSLRDRPGHADQHGKLELRHHLCQLGFHHRQTRHHGRGGCAKPAARHAQSCVHLHDRRTGTGRQRYAHRRALDRCYACQRPGQLRDRTGKPRLLRPIMS